jgi:spermidine synthase
MSFIAAASVVAISGFLSLSYEILWYRAFSFTSGGAPWVFGRVLGVFLVGLALGAFISRRFVTASRSHDAAQQLRVVGMAVVGASMGSYLVIPGLAFLATHRAWPIGFLLVAVAALVLGLVLPVVSHLGIAPDNAVGARLSFLYLASVLGSALGCLLTGFVFCDLWSAETISIVLALMGVVLGAALSVAAVRKSIRTRGIAPAFREARMLAAITVVAALAILTHHTLFAHLYERLLYKDQAASRPPFAEVVETRGGVVAVSTEGVVYGGGVYDGMIETDLIRDQNLLVRAYALGAMRPRPSRILMVGLGTGAWATALLQLPGVEHLTAVEINAGYLPIIARHAEVRGLLTDPRVSIVIDDGRRWLAQHPLERFDAIVMNTSWYWRAHSSNLLSSEFMQLAREHLTASGIFYFNTTWSPDAMKTGMSAFPYGMRCLNFIALSNEPIQFDSTRWDALLRGLRREDGRLVFNDRSAGSTIRLDSLLALGSSIEGAPISYGLERRSSVLERTAYAHIITDDNMRVEWRATPPH